MVKEDLLKTKRIDGEIIDDTRTNFFTTAIPGQSLTGEPKQYAWERPPEYDTPEDALKFYLPKITEDETVDDIMLALENDFPLSTLVRGIYMNGVMEGLHSIDVGLLIAPVLHEVIKSTAKTYGVEFREMPVTDEQRLQGKEKQRLASSVKRFLEKVDEKDQGTEFVVSAMEATEQEPPQEAPQEMPEQQPQAGGGLMSRSM